MKVLVCGGRFFDDRDMAFFTLDRMAADAELIVHGGARGADTLAQEWADDRGVCCMVYPADWKKYGPSAGPRRNQLMLDAEKPDLVIAFPGGVGTKDMVTKARAADVRVYQIHEVKS